MANHVLLDNVTHKDLKIKAVYAAGCGYDLNLTGALPVEFGQLQREYPLFFIKNAETGHFAAIALLGFAEGENLYLGDNGWDADYLPLTIQRQPFLIGFQEQDVDGVPTEVPVVNVDLDHPSASNMEGEPVFLPHGGESPYLERINSILATIHQGHKASESLSQLLVGLELIESLTVDIEFKDGSKHSLAGLYTINEEKLRKLNADGLAALHEKGHLQDIFMMLASLANVGALIDRKNRRLAE